MTNEIIKVEYESLIYEFRGYKVMLDFDLATLYDLETKRLKEKVRRNIKRFPSDFMFELNSEEFGSLRTQFATSKRGGHRYSPMVFTEHGVSMLSSILNSDKAIQINIEIMRAFSHYRSILKETEELKKDILKLDSKLTKGFKFLLDKIDALHQKKDKTSRKKIGYKSYEK